MAEKMITDKFHWPRG